MQYWPRKRALNILPSVNWDGIIKANSDKKLLGFIGYKVGMKSLYVKDNTPDSMTKNKRIIIPVTIIECPPMKILSIRFYKNKKVISDILSNDLDKNLRKKIKMPKKLNKKIDDIKDFDDVRIIAYSLVKNTGIKKRPDIIEIALSGSKEDKLNFIKENLNKEINPQDVFNLKDLVDAHGLTKGKGLQGPVKRFGIGLRQHKSEKGQRKVGSIGPWHPARVTFRTPMAGQLGMFTRMVYNNKIIVIGNISKNDINSKSGFNNYGKINTNYIILNGSVQGPSKRALILTHALRKTRKQEKKNYEFIELR